MPLDWTNLSRGSLEWTLEHVPRILLVLALAFLAVRAGRRVLDRLEHRLQRQDRKSGQGHHRAGTLVSILSNVLSVTVWSIALLQVLAELGVKLGPILTGAGIAGIALGFGAQSLVRDFLTGFFVLLEDQYRLGDTVQINGSTGVVERFSLRLTCIRSIDGTLHNLANGKIDTVSNASAGWSSAIVDIGAPYGESLGALHGALNRAGEELLRDGEVRELVLDPPKILGIEEFAATQILVRVSIKTVPGAQLQVARTYRQKVKTTFDEEGINLDAPATLLVKAPVSAGVGATAD